MARYIDADKFTERIKASPAFRNVDDGLLLQRVVIDILNNMPAADAVPKSEVYDDHHKQVACYTLGCREGDKIKREVAREIFEKIEESIATHAYTSKSEDYMDGAFDTIEWVDSKIDELKKKYTEGAEI